jgi:alkanesulfonate monooxygenase SsuD/methylene tetrahydromethanopterin reductase-like flavin-dependent oxidoreductase (luciferase family)
MAPSPSLLLAALTRVTNTIRLGPMCYILPLYNPLRLIEEICMLDQLSDGRLEVGIGRGVSSIEMSFYGFEMGETRPVFEEVLEILELGLANETLSFDGEHFHFDTVPMVLGPRQKPHPPYWYPTSNLESVPYVAGRGYHTIFQGSLEHVAAQVDSYKEHFVGDDLSAMKLGILRYCVVAESDDEAIAIADRSLAAHFRNLDHLARWQGQHRSITRVRNVTQPENARDAIRTGWGAIGSPRTVVEQISEIAGATGCNYLVFNPLLAETPTDLAISGVERFCEEVLPALR